jgi:hypothetical protein
MIGNDKLTEKEPIKDGKSKKFQSIFISTVIGMFCGIGFYGITVNDRGVDFLLTNILLPLIITVILLKFAFKSQNKEN